MIKFTKFYLLKFQYVSRIIGIFIELINKDTIKKSFLKKC